MYNTKIRVLYLMMTLATIIFIFIISIQFSNKALAESNPINISTTPESILFNVQNMKPGDWAERNLTIQNRGESDFSYYTEASFKGGSKKLHDELFLHVTDQNGSIFKGKLRDFSKIDSRFLKSLHEEQLNFLVEFPKELGNEFQGLEFEVEFKFIAEGKVQSPEPVDSDKGANPQKPIDQKELGEKPKEGHILPSTATNYFNYLFIGMIVFLIGISYFYRNRIKSND